MFGLYCLDESSNLYLEMKYEMNNYVMKLCFRLDENRKVLVVMFSRYENISSKGSRYSLLYMKL